MISLLKNQRFLYFGITLFVLCSAFEKQPENPLFSITVKVEDLRNENGVVLFALYNREDSFPDEHYEKYYKKLVGAINNESAMVTFKNLPRGKYAVNILHDEDNDGKIKKGMVLPKEGIGFSRFQSISLFNRPTFNKASFQLEGDKEIVVNILYL